MFKQCYFHSDNVSSGLWNPTNGKLFKETKLSPRLRNKKKKMHKIWKIFANLEICEVVETKVMEGDDGWTLEVQKDKKRKMPLDF